MKRLMALSIFVIALGSVFSAAPSWAQDENENRTANPGDDPNEAKPSRASEADVAAPGICPECIARLKHTRLGDDTTYRPKGTTASGGGSGNESYKDGTR